MRYGPGFGTSGCCSSCNPFPRKAPTPNDFHVLQELVLGDLDAQIAACTGWRMEGMGDGDPTLSCGFARQSEMAGLD